MITYRDEKGSKLTSAEMDASFRYIQGIIEAVVVSSNTTAEIEKKYHVTANATFTDPASPVEGKGYEVFVRNGVATIGGVDYPVGSYVFRTYHSGSWGSQLIGGSSGELTEKDIFGTTQNEWIGYPSGWVSTNQPTTTGTADNVSPSFAGNEFLKTWRRRYVSASTAGSSVEFRDASFRNIAIGSGFTAVFKFGFEDASFVANARSFVGFLGSNATFGNVNPSTQTNLVGVSNDTGEANLQLIHRGSGGTAVKIDLGANFPSNTSATDEYMLILVNEFGSTEVTYYVYRLNTSDVATGTITTDLPASTVGLSPYFWRNNGTTALAVRLSLMKYGLYKRF